LTALHISRPNQYQSINQRKSQPVSLQIDDTNTFSFWCCARRPT